MRREADFIRLFAVDGCKMMSLLQAFLNMYLTTYFKEEFKMSKKAKILVSILVVLLIVSLGITAFLLLRRGREDDTGVKNLVIDTSATNIQKSNEALAQRQIHFPGLPDGAIEKTAPVLLRNPASNEDIFLQYTIIDDATGDKVFETDLIASDQMVEWIPGATLSPGEYSFTLVEQPYYKAEGSEGWLPLTTGNNHVSITIME